MLNDKQQSVTERFPQLQEPKLLQEITSVAREVIIKPGERLINIGESIKNTPLVLEGVIKVSREDENGQEVLLYYLDTGETCAMSVTCCMKQEKSKIKAVVEEEARVLLIPFHYMDDWMSRYTSWKNFIMQTYSARFDGLIRALDSVVFESLEERLINYLHLKQDALKNSKFHITHKDISQDLNTSREAISRLLKKMELAGTIKLGRNQVELFNGSS